MSDDPEVDLLKKIHEFLNSTPEEVRYIEEELEDKLRKKKFTVIEGGKGDGS